MSIDLRSFIFDLGSMYLEGNLWSSDFMRMQFWQQIFIVRVGNKINKQL